MQLDDAINSFELADAINQIAAFATEDELPSAVRWEIVQFYGFNRTHGITPDNMYNVTVWTEKKLWAQLKMVNQAWAHYLAELRLPGRDANAFDGVPDALPDITQAYIDGAFSGLKEGVGNVVGWGGSMFKNLLWLVPVGVGLYLFAPQIRKIIVKG